MDRPIPTRKQDLVLDDKKRRASLREDFVILADQRMKIKEEKKTGQIFRPCQGAKNVKHENDGDSVCYWAPYSTLA